MWTSSEWQSLLDAEENGSPDEPESEVTMGDTRSFGRLLLSAAIVIGIGILGIMLSAGG